MKLLLESIGTDGPSLPKSDTPGPFAQAKLADQFL